MHPTAKEKKRLIDSILTNGTYLPDSGMMQRLRASLMTLSKLDLAALDLIVKIRIESEGGQNPV